MTNERAAVIFNGIYTIKNVSTGEYRTFRIETQKKDAKFAPGERILSLLSGPNNTNDYEGFAFVTDQGVTVWQKKRVRTDPKRPTVYEWFAYMLWDLAANGGTAAFQGKLLGDVYELKVAGTCLRCNRTLTTPESIDRGIGPICAEMS